MRVLVAMSGGVDSSVAAALLVEAGHEVVGATMKLWGGVSDSGCCSLADVRDARRVADQLGVEHHVFNFTEEFDARVVQPFVDDHAAGRTPNPCAECNRHLKFDRFLRRARRLGFDAIATGHHARVVRAGDGGADGCRLLRGADRDKDQSYVLSMLDTATLDSVLLPVGEMTKPEVRAVAARLGLRTALKPDSQDVCFITSRSPGPPGHEVRGGNAPAATATEGAAGAAALASGRGRFLVERIELHPGRVLDAATGELLGSVPAVELVTVGQRRGLGTAAGERRFALAVDVAARTVLAGPAAALEVSAIALEQRTWVGEPLAAGEEVTIQASAHGEARPARTAEAGVELLEPGKKVAPGQLVALYRGDEVVGSGVAAGGEVAVGAAAGGAA